MLANYGYVCRTGGPDGHEVLTEDAKAQVSLVPRSQGPEFRFLSFAFRLARPRSPVPQSLRACSIDNTQTHRHRDMFAYMDKHRLGSQLLER